jgi:AAA15 family ATPase/GTPase
MTPKLQRFRVTHFRSVDDSGWIEVDNVAALIGTNESGKTNILLPPSVSVRTF